MAPNPRAAIFNFRPNEGSSIGGPTPPYGGTGTANGGWTTLSNTTYHTMVLSGSTGAKKLTMAFVQGGVNPIEIIRQPQTGESPTSPVAESRLYNQAQIRVLLADDPSDLPGGATDSQNIRLANVKTNSLAPDYSHGVPAAVPGVAPSGQPYMTYFAEASTAVQNPTSWTNSTGTRCLPSDWTIIPATPAAGAFTLMNYETLPVAAGSPGAPVFTTPQNGYPPLVSSGNPISPNPACFANTAQAAGLVPPAAANSPTPPTTWNLIDGYLRVEIVKADGTAMRVTKEWLELGFARGLNPPKAASPNTVHPNAILIFQQPADRDGNGSLDTAGAGAAITTNTTTTCVPTGCKCRKREAALAQLPRPQPLRVSRSRQRFKPTPIPTATSSVTVPILRVSQEVTGIPSICTNREKGSCARTSMRRRPAMLAV